MRASLFKALLFGLGAAVGCLQLESIPEGVCGNGLVDAGEDCDTHPLLGMSCGAPEGEHPCRFDCGGGDGTACKSGWVCGEDSVCREPSGAFTAMGNPFPATAGRLWIHDFDADGQKDVLHADPNGLAIHYLGPDLHQEELVSISTRDPRPAIGELTDDQLPDIVLTTSAGIAVLRGQEGRVFSPTAYSSLSIPLDDVKVLVAEVLPELLGDEPLAISRNFMQTTQAAILLPKTGGQIDLLHVLDFPFTDLAERVAVGHLINDESSPCEEIAYGQLHSPNVFVFATCRVAGGTVIPNSEVSGDGTFIAPIHVQLPGDAEVVDGVSMADMNGDGLSDLVIGSNTARTFVSENLGAGAFSEPTLASFPELPLAIGHLDGDGVLDYVDACGIHVTSRPFVIGPPGCTLPSRDLPDDQKWTEAVIADLNANGLLDVAAGSSALRGVSFYSGAGEGLFSAFEIPTEGPVGHMALGDFDGDVVNDLVISEVSRSKGDSLSILFGVPYGPPESPASIGRLGELRQLIPANLVPIGQSLDGPTDLMTLSRYTSMSQQGVSIARLNGSTDRQLYSRYAFVRDLMAVEPVPNPIGRDLVTDRPEISLVGQFVRPEEHHRDIAALTRDGTSAETGLSGTEEGRAPYRFWAVASTGEAELDSVDPTYSRNLELGGDYESSIAAPLDLDNDGIDELIVLVPTIGANSGKSLLMILRIQGERWVVDQQESVDEVFTATALPSQAGPSTHDGSDGWEQFPSAPLEVLDIDGDGDLDFAAIGLAAGGAPEVTRIVVFWNEGGRIDVSARSVVLPPEGAGGPFIGLTFLQADTDPNKELVALTRRGVSLADANLDASPRTFTFRPGLVLDVPRSRAIAAADMNGDGFDDLIVARDSDIQIYVGLPVRP